jgi:3-oxoacyl-[acyl-carrier-protein] synthase III
MNGKEVYKFATGRVPEVLAEALENAGVTADEVHRSAAMHNTYRYQSHSPA